MKKFLRKIPGGIFGPDNEAELFHLINLPDKEEQMKEQHFSLLQSCPAGLATVLSGSEA